MTYTPHADRYDRMIYRRCGASGVMLPAISIGLWHNFGHDTPHETKRAICQTAFDHGITHFDLANIHQPVSEVLLPLWRAGRAPYTIAGGVTALGVALAALG